MFPIRKLQSQLLFAAGFLYPALLLLITASILLLSIIAAFSMDRINSGMLKGSILLVGFFIFMANSLLKGLFFKIPNPDGHKIVPADSPRLFALLSEIKRQIRGSKIHGVLVDGQLNAYITEVPRLGVFLGYKRYLVVGLPLMLALNEQELKEVLAHEYAHFSKKHGKESVRHYRSWRMWTKILEDYKARGKKNFLIEKFIFWYLPKLHDITFETRKAHEYEADRVAAKIAGKQAVADSLVKSELYHIKKNRFFSTFDELVKDLPQPIKDCYHQMEKAFSKPLTEELSQAVVEAIGRSESLPSDSHPSIMERISAVGAVLRVPEETRLSAYRSLFQGDALMDRLDNEYAAAIRPIWEERHKNHAKEIQEFSALDAKYANGLMTEDEALSRAFIAERCFEQKALEAYEQGAVLFPGSMAFKYHIQRLKLKTEAEPDIKGMEALMEEDPQLIPHVCRELMSYYLIKGDKEKAKTYYYYAVSFMGTNEAVSDERNNLRLSDTLLPHDLSNETIKSLIAALKKYPRIKKAYIGMKKLEHSNDFSLYCIGIAYRTSARKAKAIQDELTQTSVIGWEAFFFPLKQNKELELKLINIPNSRII